MKFTDSHEWVEVYNDFGRIGITQYAAKELGEVISIELPKIGQKIEAGKEVCVFESTKAAADIYSPVSGTVIRVNENLFQNIYLFNDDPEGKGWLFEVKISNPLECEKLLEKKQYLELVQ